MAAKDSVTLSEQPETPFHDLDHYLAIPRVSGLALSPDGGRLVTTVATLNAKGTEYCTALWEVDPNGATQARRITRSAKGEAGAVFAANGDLYFTSARPDPESPEADPVNALWVLPSGGGEARVALSRAGGISGVLAAAAADTLAVAAPVLAGSTDADYMKAYQAITGVLDEYAPELLLVSAGFDAHEDDPLASMRMTAAGYGAVVKSLADSAARAGCPMALVTEGGYDLDAVRACLDACLAVVG